MTDRAITFSLPMVDALWHGRKTQTRRLLRGYPAGDEYTAAKGADDVWRIVADTPTVKASMPVRMPYAVGDRLWVREPYYQFGHWERTGGLTPTGKPKWAFAGGNVAYELGDRNTVTLQPGEYPMARDKKAPGTPRWYRRLARFMPREHSRITLHVTQVRVMRLQETSEADCMAEGVVPNIHRGKYGGAFIVPIPGSMGVPAGETPQEAYGALMDGLHGEGFWATNPWIVAVTFDVVKQPIGRKP